MHITEQDHGIGKIFDQTVPGWRKRCRSLVSEVIIIVHSLSRSPSINRNISRRRLRIAAKKILKKGDRVDYDPACIDLADKVREFIFDTVVCQVKIGRIAA